MKTQHTPGPWLLDNSDWPVIVTPHGSTDIISLTELPKGSDGMDEKGTEFWANARLIAAAPDLLAALTGLVNICTHPKAAKADMREMAREARAAIAKATGTEVTQ